MTHIKSHWGTKINVFGHEHGVDLHFVEPQSPTYVYRLDAASAGAVGRALCEEAGLDLVPHAQVMALMRILAEDGHCTAEAVRQMDRLGATKGDATT